MQLSTVGRDEELARMLSAYVLETVNAFGCKRSSRRQILALVILRLKERQTSSQRFRDYDFEDSMYVD